MTPENARERARKLVALAAPGSGAAPEEARSAAHAAAKLIIEHDLLDGGAPASAIDLDQVTELALKAMELEHTLTEERAAHALTRAAHARAMTARDQGWRAVVDRVRKDAREERIKAQAERKVATRRAIIEDRAAQGRVGGKARDRKLSSERKAEIGRSGAEERWRKWRAERGLEPR